MADSACGYSLAFPLAAFDHPQGCPSPPLMIANWYHVVAPDALGRSCRERLQCGDLVYVEGKVQSAAVITESGDPDFTVRSRCQVVAETVMILSDAVQNSCVIRNGGDE